MDHTIFLVTNKEIIQNIFPSGNIEGIPILDKDDIIAQTINTKEIKYIISTWYFPEFERYDIETYFPKLKYIFYAAGDITYFSPAFLEKGVKIFDSKICNSKSVADFALGQILLANKGYFKIQYLYRKTKFKLRINKLQSLTNNYPGNHRSKVGLLGFGEIARQLTLLLKEYSFDIYIYDPYVSEEVIEHYGAKKTSLKYIFKNCSIVSNHLPDLPDTQKIINYELLSLMVPYATFINTGRGRQVNEFDLWRHSIMHKDFTGLLDVTRYEPILPLHPLYFLNNIFITPHIAGSQSKEKQRMGEYIFQKYEEILKKEEGDKNEYI